MPQIPPLAVIYCQPQVSVPPTALSTRYYLCSALSYTRYRSPRHKPPTCMLPYDWHKCQLPVDWLAHGTTRVREEEEERGDDEWQWHGKLPPSSASTPYRTPAPCHAAGSNDTTTWCCCHHHGRLIPPPLHWRGTMIGTTKQMTTMTMVSWPFQQLRKQLCQQQ